LFGALGAAQATADTVAFTPSGTVVSAGAPDDAVNLGLVFTANTSISVDALGFYDPPLVEFETVGLYNSSGVLLASTTVSSLDPTVDGYFFASITPVALTAGDQYTVDAEVGNNNWFYGSTAPNQAADVTYNYHDYAYGGSGGCCTPATGLAFPTLTASAAGGSSGTYYGPNFEFTAASTVPEPGTLALLVTALALVGFLNYRKMFVHG